MAKITWVNTLVSESGDTDCTCVNVFFFCVCTFLSGCQKFSWIRANKVACSKSTEELKPFTHCVLIVWRFEQRCDQLCMPTVAQVLLKW